MKDQLREWHNNGGVLIQPVQPVVCHGLHLRRPPCVGPGFEPAPCGEERSWPRRHLLRLCSQHPQWSETKLFFFIYVPCHQQAATTERRSPKPKVSWVCHNTVNDPPILIVCLQTVKLCSSILRRVVRTVTWRSGPWTSWVLEVNHSRRIHKTH